MASHLSSTHSFSLGSQRLPWISVPLQTSNSSKMLKSTTVRATGTVKFRGTKMREEQLTEMIEKKILEAQKACEGDRTSDGCKVAWDEVEEIRQAKADFRKKLEKEDPLEYFCKENPETDECRIYED